MTRSSVLVGVGVVAAQLCACIPSSPESTSATTMGEATGTDGWTSTSASASAGDETTTTGDAECSGGGGTGTGEVEHTEAWIREIHDPAEEPVWSVPYASCEVTRITAIDRASDGSFYVLGYTLVVKDCPNNEPCDEPQVGWLRRLDANYSEQWSLSYDLDAVVLRALKASDGGVYVGGAALSDGYAPWFTRIDADGGVAWEFEFAESGWVNAIDVGPSGELVAVGEAVAGDSRDLWVARLESTGEPLWSQELGGDLPQSGVAVRVDGAGRIWAAGGRGSTDPDLKWTYAKPEMLLHELEEPRVALIDPEGEILWTRAWPVDGYCYICGALALDLLPSGDAIIGGALDGEDWLTRVDASGATVWELTGAIARDYVTSLEVDASGAIHLLAYYPTAYVAVSSAGEVLAEREDVWFVEGSDPWHPDRPLDVLTLTSDWTPLIAGTRYHGVYY